MKREDKRNVLIVDNNERVLWTFQEMLEDAGFNTLTTWSGHEALALLQSREIDVLLVDDYLPDLHATDFLERVGHMPIQPWIVVMQASKPRAAEFRRYEALGASEVVDKRDPAEVRKAISLCSAEEPLAVVR